MPSDDPRRPHGDPAGAGLRVPVYGPGNFPASGWRWYRPQGSVQMVPISGPCLVETMTGPVKLPIGWSGFLLADDAGFPMIIDEADQRRDYTPAE